MQNEIKKSALLLIEFQYEWLNKDGKLYHLMTDTELFKNSIIQAECALFAARASSLAIIHSGLMFSENYHELGNAKNGLRKAIATHRTFLAADKGCQFVAPFVPQHNEFNVSGRIGASAFAGSNLDHYLRNNNIKTLYIMGYALHVCVESTLRQAHDLGYDVVLIADASAAFTQIQQKYVLEEVAPHFAATITTRQFINMINGENKNE